MLYIFLLWPMLAGAQWTPVDYQRWQNPAQPTQYQARIGGELANFDSSGIWKPIRNGWAQTGSGNGRHWVSNGDVLKVDVALSGLTTFSSTVNGQSVSMTHKPNRIVLENQNTGALTALTGLTFPSLGAPTVIGDTLRYSLFTGAVVYEIIKKNACVSHRITFNPACLGVALTAYNLSPVQQQLALSVESDYTFNGIANPSGTVWETTLKDFGKGGYKLLMERQWAQWTDGADSVESVAQNWQIGKMRERMPMPKVADIMAKNANAKIWHNDQVSIGNGSIEDANIKQGNANTNYGASTTFQSGSTSILVPIRVLNVAAALGAGATITAATCSLYCTTNATDGGYFLYRILKPWVEGASAGNDPDSASGGGGATWNDWDCDPSEWGTAGCGNASDAGADNSSDGSGYDRWTTPEGDSTTVVTVNTWYSFTISSTLAQGWYGTTIGERGVLFKASTGIANNLFASCENATAANRPRFSFTYTTGGTPAAAQNAQVIMISD